LQEAGKKSLEETLVYTRTPKLKQNNILKTLRERLSQLSELSSVAQRRRKRVAKARPAVTPVHAVKAGHAQKITPNKILKTLREGRHFSC